MTMRLTSITTKQGDKGTTMLGNGESRLKSDQRVTAYGTIDELNSFLGFAISAINDQANESVVTANPAKSF